LNQNNTKNFRKTIQFFLLVTIVGWAGFGNAAGLFTFEDIEKPKPEFARSNGVVTARLVPRAKSSSVEIHFRVTDGGEMELVKGVDFATVDRPEVDVKNFKSAAFEIRIKGAAQDREAGVSIFSDFFTASTAFYAFNPNLEKPWIDTHATNLAQQGRVREMIVTVKDGGTLDADGAADGVITLIGGPRDSFWGYALGTLFIRFFGIFIVLSVLMMGMILSGFVFRRFDQNKKDISGDSDVNNRPENDRLEVAAVSENEVAVIAVALHMQMKHSYASSAADGKETTSTYGLWAAEGRKRIMNDRLIVFNRFNRYDN